MQCVTAVEPKWLVEMGPMFFSVRETFNDKADEKAITVTSMTK